jgi:hypothetical protein
MDETPNQAPRRPDVYDALKKAVCDGLEIVRKVEAQNIPIEVHDLYPNLSYFDPGFPRFSFSSKKDKWSDAPKDYRSIFEDSKNWLNEYKIKSGAVWLTTDIPSWQEFFELANKDEYLQRYWAPGELLKESEKLLGFSDFHKRHTVFGTIKNLLDRYIHVTKQTDFKEELFQPVYLEWERAVFESRLYFDILVPIIRLKFSFDALPLGDGLAIERMSDGIQLSRGKIRSPNMSAHDDVIVAATHALILKNWSIENGPTRDARGSALHNAAAFSDALSQTDKFFAALRTVTEVETGYCQVIGRPAGWADYWKADLPPITIFSVKAYPEQFERIYWAQDAPELDADVCLSAGRLYTALAHSSSNRLTLAARRLNGASLRNDEQDSILDVTIGLEALLGDEGKGEMTHKLATRMAALCKVENFKEHTPAEVFDFCKKIYGFRSAVAHGGHKVSKTRTVKIKEEHTVPTVELGIELLRFALRVLSNNPDYLDPHKLDLFLVTYVAPPVAVDGERLSED